MPSHIKRVMLNGKLKGMGREVDCIVSGERVSLPGTSVSELTKCGIHSAPADLPDGEYTVTFDGKTQRLRKQGLAWLAPLA